MDDRDKYIFDIIVHAIEVFLVLGIALTVYMVKKSSSQKNGKK